MYSILLNGHQPIKPPIFEAHFYQFSQLLFIWLSAPLPSTLSWFHMSPKEIKRCSKGFRGFHGIQSGSNGVVKNLRELLSSRSFQRRALIIFPFLLAIVVTVSLESFSNCWNSWLILFKQLL